MTTRISPRGASAQRQAQRLGNPQAAAIEQRQDRDVALLLPDAQSQIAGRRDRGAGIRDRQRLRHALRQLRRAQHRQARR